jgi:hypothetical protein
VSPWVVVSGCVAAPGSAGLGDQPGGVVGVVAEHVRDDGRWCLEDELAECRGPTTDARDPVWRKRLWAASGVMGWPPRRPGNSQRASGLVPVVRLSRWSMVDVGAE